MDDREKIAARIRALLAKTVDNGCTEDETIAAAAKAAELLARYNLTLDEVELRKAPFTRHREPAPDAVGERLWKPADAIAKLTGARYWMSGPGVHPVVISFFGFDHEVDVAKYMIEICGRAMRTTAERLAREYGLFRPAVARMKIAPFLDGMADRLRERILELIPPEPTGTGLIVLRGELIDAAMALEGITLNERHTRASRDHEAAYRDGLRAGDGVALNPGLGRGSDARRLGARS